MKKLTPAQERTLEAIRAHNGSKVYNGRARQVLIALRDAGLIRLDSDWNFDATKGRIRATYYATAVRPEVES